MNWLPHKLSPLSPRRLKAPGAIRVRGLLGQAPPTTNRRLRLEALEDRRLLAVTPLAPDEFGIFTEIEPNDRAEDANLLGPPGSDDFPTFVVGAIQPDGGDDIDNDFYAFDLAAGQNLSVSLSGPFDSLGVLTLQDLSGVEVAFAFIDFGLASLEFLDAIEGT